MSEIVLVDTSVLMNVLDVPGFNQHRDTVLEEFERLIEIGAHLFLPMAAVFEAGNHVATLADGRLRRRMAELFASELEKALRGNAPWRPVRFPEQQTITAWLAEFPDAAMRGLGMGDLSILEEWRAQCLRYPMTRVRVWTLDTDLKGLDRSPR